MNPKKLHLEVRLPEGVLKRWRIAAINLDLSLQEFVFRAVEHHLKTITIPQTPDPDYKMPA